MPPAPTPLIHMVHDTGQPQEPTPEKPAGICEGCRHKLGIVQHAQRIPVKEADTEHWIWPWQVIWLEADGNYVWFNVWVTEPKPHIWRFRADGNLKYWMHLSSIGMVRACRKQIVNLYHLKSRKGTVLHFHHMDTDVHIGDDYRTDVMEALAKWGQILP